MDLFEIAQHLEVRHLVADGGRAHAEVVFPRECPRADRLSGLDVILDNRLEHPLFPGVKLILHALPSLRVDSPVSTQQV